jgi:hypothetical protein
MRVPEHGDLLFGAGAEEGRGMQRNYRKYHALAKAIHTNDYTLSKVFHRDRSLIQFQRHLMGRQLHALGHNKDVLDMLLFESAIEVEVHVVGVGDVEVLGVESVVLDGLNVCHLERRTKP